MRTQLILCTAFVSTIALSLSAKPVPDNLGNGLDKLVTNNLIQQGLITTAPSTGQSSITTTSPTRSTKKSAAKYSGAITTTTQSFDTYKAMIAKQSASYASRAVTDATTGNYLVEIMPNGRVPVTTLQAMLQAAYPATTVQAVDQNYAGHGVIEGYVSLNDVPGIAKTQGVGSVILELRPIHSAVTAQGVNQHRVNRINSFYNAGVSLNWDGTGMSIGVMSDSFDSQPSVEGGSTTAPVDVASQDLPGPGNVNNSQPVVVLQDYNSPPNATNEGRAICKMV